MRVTPLLTTIILIAISLDRPTSFGQMLGPNFNSAVQLVVLKNGELFRGRVSRKSDQVIVETVQGSRIVLSADETEFVCNSMEEAYWGKCARTRASDTAGQTALFHWCLKNRLLNQAQNQIDILSESDIKAADLEFLDRQLNVAILQQQNDRQRMVKTETIKKPFPNQRSSQLDLQPPDSDHSPSAGQFALTPIQVDTSIGVADLQMAQIDTSVFRPLPSLSSDAETPSPAIANAPASGSPPDQIENQSVIQQVGFNQPLAFDGVSPLKAGPSNSRTTPMQPLNVAAESDDRVMTTIAELEREMRALPRGSVGNYRQKLERGFTVGCSAANCHDSNSRVMPLLHRGVSQTIPLRQSQRNLHNILKYVDRQNPFESRLLIAASMPHAGNEEPIFEVGTPRYEHLTQWLISISDNPNQLPHNQLPQSSASDSWAAQAESGPQSARSMDQIRPVKPVPDSLQPLGNSPVKLPSTIGEIPEFDSQGNGFTPIDPFDPEIFNRKYGGK